MESNIKTDVITLSGTQGVCFLVFEPLNLPVYCYLNPWQNISKTNLGTLMEEEGSYRHPGPTRTTYFFFFFTFQSYVFTIKISGRCMAIVGTLMDNLLPYISLQTVHLSCVFFVFPLSYMSRALATKQISTLFYPTGVWED